MDGLIAYPKKQVHLGSNFVKGIYSGYISGSGNYVDIFIPCDYEANITGVTISSGVYVYTPSAVYTDSDIDFASTTVINKSDTGFGLEFKFKTTKSANTPVTVFLNTSITLT